MAKHSLSLDLAVEVFEYFRLCNDTAISIIVEFTPQEKNDSRVISEKDHPAIVTQGEAFDWSV